VSEDRKFGGGILHKLSGAGGYEARPIESAHHSVEQDLEGIEGLVKKRKPSN
jgi:hypothetical protein